MNMRLSRDVSTFVHHLLARHVFQYVRNYSHDKVAIVFPCGLCFGRLFQLSDGYPSWQSSVEFVVENVMLEIEWLGLL